MQELLKNPVPLDYTEAGRADEQVKSDAPQVAVEEAVVNDAPVSLVTLDGLDEHAAAVAAELAALDLPQPTENADDSVTTVESIAQVETPADEGDSEVNDAAEKDSQSVTLSIAQEEVAVTDSPVVEDAPVKEEEEKSNVDDEPQLEHAVGEIIIVADVEVPEGGDDPLPAVEGDVSVLEFLSEANAAGQLKPVDVQVHEQHPAWAEKKKQSKKPAIGSIASVPGLTQKPVEYIKPPGIAEKDVRNWNGYSTWWTKLGNRVAKLYNYE